MGDTIKVPIGKTIEVGAETAEEKAAREAAEEAAKNKKTPEEIAAEEAAAEAARKKAADDAAAEAAKKELENEAAKTGKTVEQILKEREEASKAGDENTIVIADNDGNDTTYKLNDKGDALNDKGEVVYTAEQLKDFEEDGDTDTGATIADIAALSGIKVVDETGAEKVYTNTVEGFAQREADIKQLGIREGSERALENFFSRDPELRAIYEYKRTYGNLDNYGSYVDYSKVTLDKENESQLMNLIITAEVAKGASKERAERLANYSKAEQTLYIDAEESLKYLNTSQAKDREAADLSRQEAERIEIQKEQNFYGIAYDEHGNEKVLNVEGSIYDMVVTKGQIGNIIIPKDGLDVKTAEGTAKHFDRRQIFDYIYTPVAEIEGNLFSQAQIDEYNRLNNKDELIASYIRNLLGGDVSQLVEIAKRKDNVKTVRHFKQKSSSQSGAKTGTGGKKVIIPLH